MNSISKITLGILGVIALVFLGSWFGIKTESDNLVTMDDTLKYYPAELTIEKGETVTWKNESALVHTVTCDPEKAARSKNVNLPEGAQAFDSGRMSKGDTFKYTFEQAGRYKYFCIPHEATGMIGVIIVK